MTHTRAPFTWDWDEPSAPPIPPPPPPLPPAPSASTPWVWTLAFSFYIWGILAGLIDGVWLVLAPASERASIAFLAFAVASVVALVPLWIFAALDLRTLEARGLRTPSILWMLLLPPIGYFIARRLALRGSGAAWRGPQIALAAVVGTQVLSAIGSAILGGALLALLGTGGGGSQVGSAPSDYGIGVQKEQANTLGVVVDNGDILGQVQTMLQAGYSLSANEGAVDCALAEPFVQLNATFPCNILNADNPSAGAQVSVTVSPDGTVSYTELPR